MRIKRICFPITVLGPGKRVGIWTTGCKFSCPGCMSPELKSFEVGKEMSVDKIIELVERIDLPIEGFTISGGEPFEQAGELLELLIKLNNISDDIIVYTGYYLEELVEKIPNINDFFSLISVLIDGRYIEELNSGKGIKGSENQNIIVFKYPEKYNGLSDCKRELQVLNYYDSSTLIVGIL